MTPHPLAGAAAAAPAVPWWRFGFVWLVISGPAIVVVAGFTTLWIAMRAPDPVMAEDYYRQGIEINRTLEAREAARLREAERSLAPAMKARNHAATPTDDLIVPAPASAR